MRIPHYSTFHSTTRPPGPVGLLLAGGGARAAYQVGVLRAIAELRRAAPAHGGASPFNIVTGTSAGAINAAAVASHADDFERAVQCMAGVWGEIQPEQVYRPDALPDPTVGWRLLWGLAQLLNRWRGRQPRSLLDNAPLAELLKRVVPLERLPALLAVSASNCSSGEHHSFYQSARAMRCRASSWTRWPRTWSARSASTRPWRFSRKPCASRRACGR